MGAILKILKEIGKKLFTRKPGPAPKKIPKDKKKKEEPCKGKCQSNNPYKNRTREQNEQSAESERNLIREHKDKLDQYSRDPYSMDNKGLLRNAPNDEVRARIIEGRKKVLRDAIERHRSELRKIEEALRGQ